MKLPTYPLCLHCMLFILSLLKKSKATVCYNCSSALDSRCGDPFKPIPEWTAFCRRGVDCIKMLYNGHIIRYCKDEHGPRTLESSLYDEVCFDKVITVTDTIPFIGTQTEEQRVRVCKCDQQDLCNKSTQHKTPSWIYVLIFVTFWFIY